jgi:hypothetical protein
MLATLVTAVISGLRGELVRVEVDVAPGLPVCHIVGLPDAALSEARERVRGAIRNSGFDHLLARIGDDSSADRPRPPGTFGTDRWHQLRSRLIGWHRSLGPRGVGGLKAALWHRLPTLLTLQIAPCGTRSARLLSQLAPSGRVPS